MFVKIKYTTSRWDGNNHIEETYTTTINTNFICGFYTYEESGRTNVHMVYDVSSYTVDPATAKYLMKLTGYDTPVDLTHLADKEV